LPFDPGNPKQMHTATLAGVASLIALSRHVPAPFAGPAQLIVSARRSVWFFHPEMPWQKLLPGPRMVHVVAWDHNELFQAGREHIARLLKFMLEEEAPSLDALAEPRSQPARA
jgi:hypothetical protein